MRFKIDIILERVFFSILTYIFTNNTECILYWSIADLQYYVSFRCTAFLQIILCYRLLQDNGYTSPCYTVCFLPILYTVVVPVNSVPLFCPSPFHLPFGNHKFVFYICESYRMYLVNAIWFLRTIATRNFFNIIRFPCFWEAKQTSYILLTPSCNLLVGWLCRLLY